MKLVWTDLGIKDKATLITFVRDPDSSSGEAGTPVPAPDVRPYTPHPGRPPCSRLDTWGITLEMRDPG